MRRRKDWPGESTVPADLSLIVDFLNTRDLEKKRDAWEDPAGLARWLEQRGLLSASTVLEEADVERARAAREGLRALLGTRGGASANARSLAGLDQVAAISPCRVRFDDDGTIRLEAGSEGLAGVLGELFARVVAAHLDGRLPRLKICSHPACRRAFYDDSNNRRGKWCATRRCGDKVRAKRYRRSYKQRHGKTPRGGGMPWA